MGREFENFTGRRYTRLTVVRRAESIKYATGGVATRWECVCDCGAVKIMYAGGLKSGLIKSCGCLNRENARGLLTTHGKSQTRVYNIWQAMIERCRNPKAKAYPYYGAMGISVCDRWHKFENFFADMGEPPTKTHSIDRFPNKLGNYEPENCRWATLIEQARNRTDNVILTINGVSKCVTEWAEETGADRNNIYRRLRKGVSPERAIQKGRVKTCPQS